MDILLPLFWSLNIFYKFKAKIIGQAHRDIAFIGARYEEAASSWFWFLQMLILTRVKY